MSKPDRFDLDKAIASWRRTLVYNRAFLADDLDELEQHVRDQVAALQAQGLPEKGAFRRTMREMGSYGEAEVEYRKVYWGKLKRRRQLRHELTWSVSMLKNYLKIALRNARRHPGYTFINVAGLAVGMACCLLIARYVGHELSYDRFHEHADRIYRVATQVDLGSETRTHAGSQGPLASALAADFPDVERAVRLIHSEVQFRHEDREFLEPDVFFADSAFFEVFSFSLLRGNPQTALAAPNRVVLTDEAARKYFGDEDPVGRTLVMEGSTELTVAGILNDVPQNSHFTFDMLVSMGTAEASMGARLTSWNSIQVYTYVLLAPGHQAGVLESRFPEFLTRRLGAEHEWTLLLEPLRRIYLYTTHRDPIGETGTASNLYVFSCIALFILLIACVNFMNLATARSEDRAREVGVRKVAGAQRIGLAGQFLLESTVLAIVAAGGALVLAVAMLPTFGVLADKPLSGDIFFAPPVLLLFAVAVLVGLLAGSYPALVLSHFRPAEVLKGTFSRSSRGTGLRKALVVFQFSASVILIAGTAIVFSQVQHMQRQRLGFEKENLLVVYFRADPAVQGRLDAIKQELQQHAAVRAITASSHVPGTGANSEGRRFEIEEGVLEQTIFNVHYVDYEYLSTYGIEPVAGRLFSRDFPQDSTEALILNEAAVQHYGFASAEAALGRRWTTDLGTDGRVVGVIKDFHFRSLHTAVEPLALRIQPARFQYLTMRLSAGDLPQMVRALEDRWKQVIPEQPFEYRFLDEHLDRHYAADLRFGQIFGAFAGLAIFIACLGLLGLAGFTVKQRTKEIGVRKVLGASVASLLALLTREILGLVLVAFIAAVPLAYVIMSRWLENFAYRIDLGPGVFVLAGVLVVLIALVTVSYQSIKAASANPVESLRYE